MKIFRSAVVLTLCVSLLPFGLAQTSTPPKTDPKTTPAKQEEKKPTEKKPLEPGKGRPVEKPVEQDKDKDGKPIDPNKKELPKDGLPTKAGDGKELDPKLNGADPLKTEQPNGPSPFAPVVFEGGPFNGLEAFGFSYFAAARENVKIRTAIKAQPEIITDPNKVNALENIAGPSQMTFQNIAMPAPDRYQLGPGDKLQARYWSPTSDAVEATLTIDQTGSVTVPVMGTKAVLRGMTLVQAEAALTKELRRGLREASITLSLSELRTISVSVVGEVVAQGNYQFPSVMTAFNAIFAAGGPTMNGSMRKIQLRRANGKAITIDLYAYLIKGDASQDVPLQPGDLILVPVATNRVAVKGEVSRPAVYEVSDKDTLRSLLSYAGGAKGTAVTNQVEIATYEAGGQRQIVNVDLAAGKDAPVQGDDIITLYPIRNEFQNVITIEGAVDQPRQYQLSAGMTIADAIEKARGVLVEAYMERADLYRENPDKTYTLIPINLSAAIARDASANVTLQQHDKLRVYSRREMTWLEHRVVEVKGAVRNPGEYIRMEKMRVSDLLLQAGGLLPDASTDQIFLYHRNPDGTEGNLIKLNVAAVMQGRTDEVLTDRDMVLVLKQSEANYKAEQRVSILGAVLRPGAFIRSDNLTLRDLIEVAGGFIPGAGEEIQISKSRVSEGTAPVNIKVSDIIAGTLNPKLGDGDVVSVPYRGDFQEAPLLVEIKGRVKKPGVYALNSKTETLRDLIDKAGGLTEDAWDVGVHFLRNPRFLTSEPERRLSPRMQEIFDNLHQDEYMRALAQSDIEKIRIINAQARQPLQGFAALTGGQQQQTSLPPTAADLDAAIKTLQARELVSPARDFNKYEVIESGNIPIRLDLALRDRKSEHNVVLKDGDIIIIPEIPETVAVRGAVYVPSTVLYEGVKTLQYYIDRSGGLAPDADREQILIIRATGSITKARPSTKVELGDTIFVPTKVMVTKLTNGSSTADTIFQQITSLGLLYSIFKGLF